MANKQFTQTEIKKIADELKIMEAQLQLMMERVRTLKKIIIPDDNDKPRKKTKKQLFQEDMDHVWAKRMARILKSK